MANGMWTAASGAIAQAQNLDLVANNLANVDTLAFKKNIPTFKEYLAIAERESEAQDIPRGPIKDKDFYPLDGKDQSHVILDNVHTNYRQGNLRVTHDPLDIALDGPGFLEVSTPQGLRYTRQGNLKVNAEGVLVTIEGNPVLSAGEAAPGQVVGRLIHLEDRKGQISINSAGEIFSEGESIGSLGLIEFRDLKVLQKSGASLFENKGPPTNRLSAEQTSVHQGVLETSNVNPVEEMVQMIKSNRLFEQDLKSLKTYNEMIGREVNDVGKL